MFQLTKLLKIVVDIKNNVNEPYYIYLSKILSEKIFFLKAHNMNLSTDAREYFEINNIINNTNQKYLDKVTEIVKDEKFAIILTDFVDNYNNVKESGENIETVYCQIITIINSLFKNKNDKESVNLINDINNEFYMCYNKNYQNLTYGNVHNITMEKSRLSIENKLNLE